MMVLVAITTQSELDLTASITFQESNKGSSLEASLSDVAARRIMHQAVYTFLHIVLSFCASLTTQVPYIWSMLSMYSSIECSISCY